MQTEPQQVSRHLFTAQGRSTLLEATCAMLL